MSQISEYENALQQWKPTASDFIPGVTSMMLLAVVCFLIAPRLKLFPFETSVLIVLIGGLIAIFGLVQIWLPLFGSGKSVRSYLRWKAWLAVNPNSPIPFKAH